MSTLRRAQVEVTDRWRTDCDLVLSTTVGSSRDRRITLAVVVVVLAASVVAACGDSDDADRSEVVALRADACPDTRTDRPPSMAPASPTTIVVCHRLSVPVDYDRPDVGHLDLAVVVVSSPGSQRGREPVVVIHGGPGASLTDHVSDWLDPLSPLVAERDLILVDQRGAGRSRPRLDCSVGEQLDSCRDRLIADGVHLGRFGSFDQARDMAALRRALGYERWSVYAVSFGTRVALQLLRVDPDGTRSLVLDSVYPPDIESGAEQAPNAAAAILAALGSDDRRATLDEVLADLDREAVTVSWTDDAGLVRTDTVDAELFAARLFGSLYETGRSDDVATSVDRAAEGDWVAALAAIGVPDVAGASAELDDLADGAFWAAECNEGVGRSTPEEAVAAAIGRLAEVLVRAVVASIERCEGWRSDLVEPWTPATTSISTLILSGTLDPVTPTRWAHATATALGDSATVVEIPDGGHVPSFTLACAEDLIVSFFDDPASVSAGSRCG